MLHFINSSFQINCFVCLFWIHGRKNVCIWTHFNSKITATRMNDPRMCMHSMIKIKLKELLWQMKKCTSCEATNWAVYRGKKVNINFFKRTRLCHSNGWIPCLAMPLKWRFFASYSFQVVGPLPVLTKPIWYFESQVEQESSKRND